MKRKLTDEQIKALHNVYLPHNTSLKRFCRNKNINYNTTYSMFKRLNLSILPQSTTRRKYPITDDFFKHIDNEERAYFLGLFYADGTVDLTRNRAVISLAKQDEEIVKKLSMALLNNDATKEYKYQKECQPMVGLYIINSNIANDLNKHGCHPRKTLTLTFPKLPDKLINHFIRGYFDGDGSITICQRKKGIKSGYKEAQFSIVSTKEFLEEIGKHLNSIEISYSLNQRWPKRNKNNFTLRVFGNRQIEIALRWLYQGATVFLSRKYITYQKLIVQNSLHD